MGDLTHASEIAFQIPIVNWFRIPARYVLLFDVAVAVLAARMLVGIQDERNGKTLLSLLLLSAILLLAFRYDSRRQTAGLPDFTWGFPAGLLGLAVLLLLILWKRPEVLLPLLGLVILLDNVSYGQALTWEMILPKTETHYGTHHSSIAVPEWLAIMQRDDNRDFHRLQSAYPGRCIGKDRRRPKHSEICGANPCHERSERNQVQLVRMGETAKRFHHKRRMVFAAGA